MKIIIEFLEPIRKEKFLQNLRNVKKNCQVVRHYISEVKDGKYYLTDQSGNAVFEMDYFFSEEERAVSFEGFRGKHTEEVKEMLMFKLVDEIGIKAFIGEKEKKIKMFYDMDNFYLIEKKGIFKVANDNDRLIAIEPHRLPKELKNEEWITRYLMK